MVAVNQSDQPGGAVRPGTHQMKVHHQGEVQLHEWHGRDEVMTKEAYEDTMMESTVPKALEDSTVDLEADGGQPFLIHQNQHKQAHGIQQNLDAGQTEDDLTEDEENGRANQVLCLYAAPDVEKKDDPALMEVPAACIQDLDEKEQSITSKGKGLFPDGEKVEAPVWSEQQSTPAIPGISGDDLKVSTNHSSVPALVECYSRGLREYGLFETKELSTDVVEVEENAAKMTTGEYELSETKELSTDVMEVKENTAEVSSHLRSVSALVESLHRIPWFAVSTEHDSRTDAMGTEDEIEEVSNNQYGYPALKIPVSRVREAENLGPRVSGYTVVKDKLEEWNDHTARNYGSKGRQTRASSLQEEADELSSQQEYDEPQPNLQSKGGHISASSLQEEADRLSSQQEYNEPQPSLQMESMRSTSHQELNLLLPGDQVGLGQSTTEFSSHQEYGHIPSSLQETLTARNSQTVQWGAVGSHDGLQWCQQWEGSNLAGQGVRWLGGSLHHSQHEKQDVRHQVGGEAGNAKPLVDCGDPPHIPQHDAWIQGEPHDGHHWVGGVQAAGGGAEDGGAQASVKLLGSSETLVPGQDPRNKEIDYTQKILNTLSTIPDLVLYVTRTDEHGL